MLGNWKRGRRRIEALGFEGSMSSLLGSGSAGEFSTGRVFEGSAPAPSPAGRDGWSFWGTGP
jgi:hypothetical protein